MADDADTLYDGSYDIETNEEAHDYYHRWAATYDEELAELEYAQPGRAARTLAELTDDRSASILDVGCGTGLSGAALAEAGFTTIDGCDYSDDMLARAQATGVYRTLFNADLNQPLSTIDDHAYDVVTAVGCFSFGHIDVAAVRELARVIRPGGAFVIALNEYFYDEGSLLRELDALVEAKTLTWKVRERGAHMPGRNVMGWVLAFSRG